MPKNLDYWLTQITPDIRKPADGRVRSMEELILGAESRPAVSAAIRRAVEQADALGLPRAYKELPSEVTAPSPTAVPRPGCSSN